MSHLPKPPTLTPEDRRNLRALRLWHQHRITEERLKQQIEHLMTHLQTRFALSAQSAAKS